MGEMGYKKSISTESVANFSDIKYTNMDLYNDKKATNNFTQPVYNSSNSSLDLSVFLTDNINETCSATAIAADQVRHYESYDDSTWYTDLLGALNCAAATVINTGMGLLEGVAELAEGIVDTATIVASGVISVPLLLADTVNFIGSAITGEEFKSMTASFWTESIMPWVGADFSGCIFDAIYSTDRMKGVDNAAWNPMKRGNGGYKIAKNVGYVSGTILLGVFGGTSTLAATASQFSTATAGIAKAGNTIESKYNKLSDEEKKDGGKITGVLFNGGLNGGLEAATWFLTYGNGLDKVATHLGHGAKDFLGKTVFKLSGNTTATKMLAKIFPNALKNSSFVKAGVQFLKPFATLGIDASTIGLKIDENTQLTDYLFNATIDGITNAGVALTYDASFLKNIVENVSAKASTKVTGKNDYVYENHEAQLENASKINSFNGDAESKTVYKSLTEAISKFRYSPENTDFSQAQLTRLLFEGMKKSGGNIVKKNINAPFKEGVNNLFSWGTSMVAAVYK